MKGITSVLEVAITILMVIVVYVLVFSATLIPPDFETINLQLSAINSLQTLDANNELRPYVMLNDTTNITNKLSNLMPANVNLFVAICRSSCAAPPTNSSRVASVDYLVAGDVTNFNPQQVIVYVWSS